MRKIRLICAMLSICVVFNATISVKSSAIFERFNKTDALKALLAGEAQPSKELISSSAFSEKSSQLITNGIYYLNNKNTGAYLRRSGNLATVGSGLISSIGSYIGWQIVYRDGYYMIRSSMDSAKYLSVPTDTSSTDLEIVTILDGQVTNKNLWQITISAMGGCLIKSVYSGKYICADDNQLYTSVSTGTSGTNEYASRAWRLIDMADITGRELNENFSVDTCTLFSGDSRAPKINLSPVNAIWAQLTDFTFSGFDSSRVSYDETTCKFTDLTPNSDSMYSTRVTAVHKVTGLAKSFTLVIRPRAALLGIYDSNNQIHDHTSALNAISNVITQNCYSGTVKYYGSYDVQSVFELMDDDENSLFVSRGHGGVDAGGTHILIDEANGVSLHSSSFPATIDLSNMRMMLYIGCSTAYNGGNGYDLPSVSVENGAKAAVGFEDTIQCGPSNQWTISLFNLLNSGASLEEACLELSLRSDYAEGGLSNYVICGNESICLN